MRVSALIALALMASPAPAHDQDAKVVPQFVGVWDKAPDLACSRGIGITHNSYGFALAVLYSLSYGKDASDRAAEIKPAFARAGDMTSLMTELLRISKEQALDFACAEVPIASFNQPSTDTMTRMVAQNILFTWHEQIGLNDRLDGFIKSLGTMKPADMADRMSTLQVDRENLGKSLDPVITLVLLKLVDEKRIGPTNTLPYLTINKVQKAELIEKVHEYFPDVDKHEQKDIDRTTIDASLYLYMLTTHKASNED